MSADAHFLDRLTLTRVDRDIFTGYCHAGAPLRAFGGQVAAQALVAAGKPEAREAVELADLFSRNASRRVDAAFKAIEIIADSAEPVVRRLLAEDARLHDLEVQRAGLTEAFIELTREAA